MSNRTITALAGASAVILASSTARGGEIVVPNHAPDTAGTGSYSTLLNTAPRSYQLVVGPEELAGLPVGSQITGIAWRRPTWQVFGDWPGAGFTCTFANYDIQLSSSLNPPGSLSSTYTDNVGPDAVIVRSGSIALTDDFFPGGAITPAVNPFGEVIPFSAPWTYGGGDLLLTLHHTGNDCGGNGNLDTVPSPFTQAIGVSSYTQEDDWYPQGLIVMKLVFEQGCPEDTNDDGVVDVLDLINVISAWQTSDPDADVNTDGAVDVLDLVAVILAWGPC